MGLRKYISILMLLVCLFLCACGSDTAEPTLESTVPTQAPPTESVVTEPVVTEPAATEPAVERHSGIREDGSFDSGTLFIGDSLTNGLVYTQLMYHKLLGDAKYMAIIGAAPQTFFNGPHLSEELSCIYSPQFDNMIFSEAVASVGSQITAVYFMMGSNYSDYTGTDTYIAIVDYLLEHCPNATIYLQTVPYSPSPKVHYEEMNRFIQEAYTYYVLEGNSRVMLIDTKEAIGANLSADEIHLSGTGYACWYQELLAFAEENSIPQ